MREVELARDGEDRVADRLGFELAAVLPPEVAVVAVDLGTRPRSRSRPAGRWRS